MSGCPCSSVQWATCWSISQGAAVSTACRGAGIQECRPVQTVGFTHVGMAPEAYSSRFLPHQKIGFLVFLNLFPEDNKYQLLQIIVGAK